MANRESNFVVPEGWELVTEVKKNGCVLKYFTNILGQKFYSEEDLMRNIKDAKEKGLSIYAPDFDASSVGASNSRQKKKAKIEKAPKKISKKEKQSSNNNFECIRPYILQYEDVKKKVEKQHETPRARTSPQLSDQGTRSIGSRSSRRSAGLNPELITYDFTCDKPLEYVIKDKLRRG